MRRTDEEEGLLRIQSTQRRVHVRVQPGPALVSRSDLLRVSRSDDGAGSSGLGARSVWSYEHPQGHKPGSFDLGKRDKRMADTVSGMRVVYT